MKDFLANFPFQKFSIFVSIVVSFTYNVFLDRDVACTCENVNHDCGVYMGLPFVIILILILWTDKTFQRVGRYACDPCSPSSQPSASSPGQNEASSSSSSPGQNEASSSASSPGQNEASSSSSEQNEASSSSSEHSAASPPVSSPGQNEASYSSSEQNEASSSSAEHSAASSSASSPGQNEASSSSPEQNASLSSSPEQNAASSSCKCCGLFGVLFSHLLKAALVGLLWVVSVLIDGDWWVCCKNDHSKEYPHLACTDKNNITAEEQVIIAQLKNTSRMYGFIGLLVIVFVASLLPCGWRKCCRNCCKTCCQSCCDGGVVYERILLEEGETVQEEILRKAAKEGITKAMYEKIDGNGDWKECLHVTDEMINNSAGPELTEEQLKQWNEWSGEEGQQQEYIAVIHF